MYMLNNILYSHFIGKSSLALTAHLCWALENRLKALITSHKNREKYNISWENQKNICSHTPNTYIYIYTGAKKISPNHTKNSNVLLLYVGSMPQIAFKGVQERARRMQTSAAVKLIKNKKNKKVVEIENKKKITRWKITKQSREK